MAASRVPINNNPGFWSRGSRVGFHYRDPHGQRRQATAATLTEAKALKAELETDVRRGDYRAESKITVADYVPRLGGGLPGSSHGEGQAVHHSRIREAPDAARDPGPRTDQAGRCGAS